MKRHALILLALLPSLLWSQPKRSQADTVVAGVGLGLFTSSVQTSPRIGLVWRHNDTLKIQTSVGTIKLPYGGIGKMTGSEVSDSLDASARTWLTQHQFTGGLKIGAASSATGVAKFQHSSNAFYSSLSTLAQTANVGFFFPTTSETSPVIATEKWTAQHFANRNIADTTFAAGKMLASTATGYALRDTVLSAVRSTDGMTGGTIPIVGGTFEASAQRSLSNAQYNSVDLMKVYNGDFYFYGSNHNQKFYMVDIDNDDSVYIQKLSDGGMYLAADVEVSGNLDVTGIISGIASGLSGANATTLFGSGKIPIAYLGSNTPTTGQVIKATSATTYSWQDESGGSGSSINYGGAVNNDVFTRDSTGVTKWKPSVRATVSTNYLTVASTESTIVNSPFKKRGNDLVLEQDQSYPGVVFIETTSGDTARAALNSSGDLEFSDYNITGQTLSKLGIQAYGIPIGDETTTITTGTAKVTFRMPFAMTLTAVRANVNTVSSSGLPTVDINEGGTTVLSTKLTIDANEKTSTTAATAAVISDASLADDAEITIDIDVAGTGAKGLKIWLYLKR